MRMFSQRLPDVFAENRLSREAARCRAAGAVFVDLTETNPTRVGLPYPDAIAAALGDSRGLVYEPAPFGLTCARRAVAGEFARQGRPVGADRIVLTASTSEAYALLFKLLCDPGDEVLVPQPSYPLFDLLTRLDDVRPAPYRLDYHGVWSIDRPSLVAALSPRARAILIVSPNNPTGSLLRRDDLDWLAALAADRSLALVGDEVFLDYPLAPRTDGCRITDQETALTFSLGGLSKSAGLPQMKLAWIAAGGPDGLVAEALARLEVICDSYLSVATPVQHAVPALLDAGRAIREALLGRLARNLDALRARVGAAPALALLEPEGGWSAVVRVPATGGEEALALRLLTDQGVLVHPGFFFDFPHEAFLVLSLLPASEVFDEGIDRLLHGLEQS